MTSGFWKGLLHGGLISVGALSVLSLVSPMPHVSEPAETAPDRSAAPVAATQADATALDVAAREKDAETSPANEPASEPASDDDSKAAAMPTPAEPDLPAAEGEVPETAEPDTAIAEASAPDAAAPDATVAAEAESTADAEMPIAGEAPAETDPAETAPVASAVELPVGSEFGRGGDSLPTMPEPLDVPQVGLGQADAPGVVAPTAEPAPVAIAANDARPQAQGAPSALATKGGEDSAESAPEFDQPTALPMPSTPSAPVVPQLSEVVQPDQAPDMSVLNALVDKPVTVDENDAEGQAAVDADIAAADPIAEPQPEARQPEPQVSEPQPEPQPETQPEPQSRPEPVTAVDGVDLPDIPGLTDQAATVIATEPADQVASTAVPPANLTGQNPNPSRGEDTDVALPGGSGTLDLSLPPDITELQNLERD